MKNLFYFIFLFTSYIYSEIHLQLLNTIYDTPSFLSRPEGIAFSPSGDCIAIANSNGNSVTFYKRQGSEGYLYDSTPSCVLQDVNLLNYVHDICFTPCGRYVVVASRNNHKVVFLKRDFSQECSFYKEPYHVLHGDKSKIYYPTSISFSKNGKLLAVCNRMGGSGICLYSLSLSCIPGRSPINQITEEKLLKNNIAAPHGVSFSPLSNEFVVVHKQFHKNPKKRGNTSIAIFKYTNGKTHFSSLLTLPYDIDCVHSIAYHPSGRFLAVTNEFSMVMIFKRTENKDQFSYYNSVKVDTNGLVEGVKGVSFSPDGKCLAITTVYPSLLFYSFDPQ